MYVHRLRTALVHCGNESTPKGMDRDLCNTPPFAQSLRCVQILILEISNILLWLKSSRALILNEIEHFSKVSNHKTKLRTISFHFDLSRYEALNRALRKKQPKIRIYIIISCPRCLILTEMTWTNVSP